MIISRFGGRLLGIAAVSALALAVLPAAAASARPAASACPSCGHNLIVNPGADKGKGTTDDTKVKIPGWKQTKQFTAASYAWSGGDVSKSSHGPKNRGKNYFYGGPDSARSTATQVIKVNAKGISGGKAHYTLAGWLGGFSSQGDHAVVTVTFENSKGAALATASIGPVTAKQRKDTSEFLLRSTTGKVPGGTRSVQVKIVMTRTDGSDNDGLADNLLLMFKQ